MWCCTVVRLRFFFLVTGLFSVKVYDKLSNILSHRLQHALFKREEGGVSFETPSHSKTEYVNPTTMWSCGMFKVYKSTYDTEQHYTDRYLYDKNVYNPVYMLTSQSEIPVCISWGPVVAACVSCCVISWNDRLLVDSFSCTSSLCHNEGCAGTSLQD